MHWLLGPTIGRGATATVSLALFADRVLAAKSAPVSFSSSLINEESILAELRNCPHVIACFGHDVVAGIHHLLLEYLPRGSLHQLLLRHGPLREQQIKLYSKYLLEGLKSVHARGYVHCDVKPSNILVCDDGIRIADFGSATRVGPTSSTRGTPMYMSPESVARKEYSPAADIWAVGCAVIEMATGGPPWRPGPGDSGYGLMMWIGFGDEEVEIPKGVSEEGKDFLRKCLVRDPEKRWTAEMLLKHPFVTNTDTDTDIDTDTETKMSPKSILYCYMSDFEESFCDARDRIGILATGVGADWRDMDGWICVRDVGCGEWTDRIGRMATGPAPEWRDWCGEDGWVCVRGCDGV